MAEAGSKPVRIAVVGCGNVGATFAYALLLNGIASEIVLIDANHAKAEGEAMDLNHAVPFARNTRVWAGSYDDCAGAQVTVVTAGANQQPGEKRLDLLKRNADIFAEIVPKIAERNPNGVLLIATNPVDILTYLSWKQSSLPSCRVIGSGTILDTARFRHLLSEHFGVDPRSIHAFILGEHGDSEVPLWSLANVAGMQVGEFARITGKPWNQEIMDEIFRQTRDAAYQIIARKHATYYAVAAGLMRIVEAILRDQKTVLSVSSLVEDYYGLSDVCFSLPTIVDRTGVAGTLHLKLNEEERQGVKRSAEVLKKTLADIED